MLDQEQSPVMTSEQLQQWTSEDPESPRVCSQRMACLDSNCIPYKQRQHELSVQDGCVLWGALITRDKLLGLDQTWTWT